MIAGSTVIALLTLLSLPPAGVDTGPYTASWERLEPISVPPLEIEDAELSGVPILCYHHVSADPLEYYSLTPSALRMHLEVLDDAGFYLIDPDDIMNGLMSVPVDRRPVMLTFDDGWEDNFRLLESASGGPDIDPDCAVGILEAYCDQNPGFGRAAVFFISWDKIPFGQADEVTEKLNMLLDMGYTIGNHSLRHSEYLTLPADRWEISTVGPLEKFHRKIGLRTPSVYTMAYPGGFFPQASWAREPMSEYTFMGRQAVSLGFLVNGEIARLSEIYGTRWGRYYISRIDMSSYSIFRVISSRGTIRTACERSSLHDPLRFRPLPMSDTAIPF